MNFWKRKKVLVTGGASFIGSHLVDALVARGAEIKVVDNLSSGKLENIKGYLETEAIEFRQLDLFNTEMLRKMMEGIEFVFHLAACHGGRGYVDLHQAACASNLALDGLIFKTAYEAGVEKIVFPSSACVYPNEVQADLGQEIYLSESMAGPPYDADNMYGWAKLMAELTLRAYHADYGMKSVCCRYFSVFGERGHENHAVIAMIARAFVKQSPYVVWGNGEQVRNWTYVGDIVKGTLLAAEYVNDGSAINLGTSERIKVIDAAKEILRYTNHDAPIELRPEMPVGPLNRSADYSLARKLLGWEPEIKFMDGLHQTIDWYFSVKDRKEVERKLNHVLVER